MNSAYRTDERILKNIVAKNVKGTGENEVNLQIYYKSKKNQKPIHEKQPDQDGDVEAHQCGLQVLLSQRRLLGFVRVDYIGVTTTSLSRRLTMHLADGAPKEHMQQEHNTPITRKTLTQNTEIIASAQDTRKLNVLEALFIHEQAPILNRQIHQTFTLSLWSRGTRRGRDE